MAAIYRFAAGAALLAFGVFSSGLFGTAVGPKWVALTLALYAVPLAVQFLPLPTLRVYALWFGAFLMLQSLATPWLERRDKNLKTLPSEMDYHVNVIGDGIPGIQGMQRITTDRLGFRVKPPVDYESKEALRLFAIGGSTTEDIYLDDERTWTHLLQETLAESLGRPVEVINTGVSGLRAVHHLATLEYVLQFEPDAVLFLVGINDWNKQIREHFGSDHYTGNPPSPWSFKLSMLGRLLDRWHENLEQEVLLDPDADAHLRFRGGAVREDRGEFFEPQRNALARPDVRALRFDAVDADYARQLAEIGRVCHESRVICLFMTQPVGYAFDADPAFRKSFWMTPPGEDYTLDLDSLVAISRLYNTFLMDFAAREGHFVIDLASQLRPSHDIFYDDSHFNINGAREVAAIISEYLTEILSRPPERPENEVR